MTDYCEPADLYSYGLPRGSLANPGKLAKSASADGDFLELNNHGFSLNDLVSFRAESGGSLPQPLEPLTTYYAIPLTDASFSVAAAEDGDAIDLVTDGSRILVIPKLPIAKAISWGAATIDDMLPAHAVPLTAPFPSIIVITNAELAAGKLGYFTGSSSASLTGLMDLAMKRLARWAQGVPIRGENAPSDDDATNVATSATVPYSDPRGWNRFGGIS